VLELVSANARGISGTITAELTALRFQSLFQQHQMISVSLRHSPGTSLFRV